QCWSGSEMVAPHPRCYARQQIVEDFRHYVPLLLEKPFAVPFASALRHGALPPSWEQYRHQLVIEREACGLRDGNREFARILHLCLSHSLAEVSAALDVAAATGHTSADAVRQLFLWPDEPAAPPQPLDPQRYAHYPLPQPRPNLAAYNRLLQGSVSPAGTEGGEPR